MENYSNLEKLSNDLKNLFQNQNQKEEESYFDFEIICEQNQTSFKTHKSILSSRSEYFKSLFKSKMKEYQENKLILKDVSSSILSSILNYFYSGKIEINLENAIEILIFSSKYLIDELIEISSNFIKNNLQFETIIDVLKLSETMNFNQLLDYSYKFISKNFNKFIKTSFFLELEENHLNSILSNEDILTNEFKMFQSIIKWGKHKSNITQQKKIKKEEKEKLQNQISNIIDKIRFIDFTKKELKKSLKEDLIPKQISQKLIEFQKLQKNPKKNEEKLYEFIEKENQIPNSLIFKPRFKFESEIITEKEYIIKLREWINDDEFFSKMKLGFSATKDGFSSQKWHEKSDNKGKTLVIIKTTQNYIFGGFTKVGFISKNDYVAIPDPDAFIFTITNPQNDPPQKFPIRSNEVHNGIGYESENGPCFGYSGADIVLVGDLQPGYLDFGRTYHLPDGIKPNTSEAQNYFTGAYTAWKVDGLETFFI
ncbi:btb/poz domain-containing protein [Anaeramoeba ignava]|uniref:Btb/poz domain-containing protein n=1 Tax=Anaeramoeba ignava TaxID=1746090 RepID=A0A9Q0LAW3_ANAIG|nr:btb/poz domain-containing protein [Anaeramoeba ignava]